jgi:hypothetical protein
MNEPKIGWCGLLGTSWGPDEMSGATAHISSASFLRRKETETGPARKSASRSG